MLTEWRYTRCTEYALHRIRASANARCRVCSRWRENVGMDAIPNYDAMLRLAGIFEWNGNRIRY